MPPYSSYNAADVRLRFKDITDDRRIVSSPRELEGYFVRNRSFLDLLAAPPISVKNVQMVLYPSKTSASAEYVARLSIDLLSWQHDSIMAFCPGPQGHFLRGDRNRSPMGYLAAGTTYIQARALGHVVSTNTFSQKDLL